MRVSSSARRRCDLLLVLLVASGCGSSAPNAPLCVACADDGDCQGNPCFEDVSGSRFCGSPCADCPAGFRCQTVMGTRGLQRTCFPDSEVCASPDAPDLAGPAVEYDLGGIARDIGGAPVGGPVGPRGGTVDRLAFGFTGDTRPSQCGGAYPQMVIDNIYTQMKGKDVQFAIDQGDHMFNCGSGAAALSGARQQMTAYLSAAAILGKTVFMTMGNHECTGEASQLCTLGSNGSNANYTAFMDALKPISDTPYYRFDVTTSSGLAVFIVIADDTWDAAQQQWLTAQLTDADAKAKYTFVSKHHPDGNTDHPEFQQIYDLVTQHKYTLFLTGHSHLFKRQFSDGRALVIGCGGAPLAGGDFWGYGTARQGADDRIYVQVFDQATGNLRTSFDVGPQ